MSSWIRSLVLVTLLSAAAHAQTPDDWKTFSSAAGHFSVRVPGTLKESPADKPANGSPITHSFVLSSGEAAYIVTYTDFPASQIAATEPSALLKAARDGGISNVKGKLIAESTVTANGYPGRDVEASVPIEGKQGSAHFRIYLANARLYMALYVGPGESAHAPLVSEFLKSFQIVNDEPQDGWKTFDSAIGKFSVRVPGTLKAEVSDLSGGGKIHQFLLDKGDYAYIVSFNGIAGGAPKPEEIPALLNKGRDAMVSSLHGKLLDEKSVSLNGSLGKSVRVAIPDRSGTAFVRAYVVGDQYYQVMLIGANKSLDAANMDRYFRSFHFTGAEPDRKPSPDPDWTPLTSADGRFSVEMPGSAKRDTIDAQTTKYSVTAGSKVYIVVYVKVAGAVTDPAKVTDILEAARDAELNAIGAKSETERRIPLGAASGLQVTFTVPSSKIPGGGSGVERFYLVGNRLFELAVITGNAKADAADFSRFFDSFKPAAQ
jgi:hypothetical protein